MLEHSAEHREKAGRTERPHHAYHKKRLMDAIPRVNQSPKPELTLSVHQGAPVEQTAINALTNLAKNEVPSSPAIAETAVIPESPLIPKLQNYDDVDLDQLVTAAVESRDNPEPPAPVMPPAVLPEAVEVPVPEKIFEEPVEPITTPVFIEADVQPVEFAKPALEASPVETVASTTQAKMAEPEASAPVETIPPAHALGDPAELNGEKVYIEEQLTGDGGKIAYEVSKDTDDTKVLAYETALTFLDPEKEKAHEANHVKELWDANSGLIKEKFQFEHLGERWTDPDDKTINRGVDPNTTFEEQEALRLHNRTLYIMGSTIVFMSAFLTDKELHSTRHLFNTKERYGVAS